MQPVCPVDKFLAFPRAYYAAFPRVRQNLQKCKILDRGKLDFLFPHFSQRSRTSAVCDLKPVFLSPGTHVRSFILSRYTTSFINNLIWFLVFATGNIPFENASSFPLVSIPGQNNAGFALLRNLNSIYRSHCSTSRRSQDKNSDRHVMLVHDLYGIEKNGPRIKRQYLAEMGISSPTASASETAN